MAKIIPQQKNQITLVTKLVVCFVMSLLAGSFLQAQDKDVVEERMQVMKKYLQTLESADELADRGDVPGLMEFLARNNSFSDKQRQHFLAKARTKAKALVSKEEPQREKSQVQVEGADMVGANLRRKVLAGANLQAANLMGADLEDANLAAANLQGANLTGANLYFTNLGGANLEGANLSGVKTLSTNFGGANLEGANLSGTGVKTLLTNFDGASYDNHTIFPKGFNPVANGMILKE